MSLTEPSLLSRRTHRSIRSTFSPRYIPPVDVAHPPEPALGGLRGGWPTQARLGLSGAVRQLDRVLLPLVRFFCCPFQLDLYAAFAKKTQGGWPIQRRLRSGESCSTASPPDDRTTLP